MKDWLRFLQDNPFYFWLILAMIAATGLANAGCSGPMVFAKDGGGQQDLQNDMYDCKEQWNRSGPGMAYARDPMGSLGYLAMYRSDLQACMERKGWQRVN